MNYYIVIIIVPFVIGLWNLMIAILGLFPQFLSTTVGTLTNAKTKKNDRTRHGHRIPISTSYTYTYIVKGKEYRYSNGELYSKRRLLPKASMEYVTWFPRHAYPHKFKGTNEWVIGLAMCFLGVVGIFAILSIN